MKMTLKKDLNYNSIVLEHEMVTQAVVLIEGREMSLGTEKRAYTLLGVVHNLCEEDIITECNVDTRSLIQIIKEDIEPFYFDLIKKEPELSLLYDRVYTEVENYCARIYRERNSFMGIFNTLLDIFAQLDNNELQEVLVKTAEVAGEVKEKRDKLELEQEKKYKEQVLEKQEQINQNLVKMMAKYNVKLEEEKES